MSKRQVRAMRLLPWAFCPLMLFFGMASTMSAELMKCHWQQSSSGPSEPFRSIDVRQDFAVDLADKTVTMGPPCQTGCKLSITASDGLSRFEFSGTAIDVQASYTFDNGNLSLVLPTSGQRFFGLCMIRQPETPKKDRLSPTDLTELKRCHELVQLWFDGCMSTSRTTEHMQSCGNSRMDADAECRREAWEN